MRIPQEEVSYSSEGTKRSRSIYRKSALALGTVLLFGGVALGVDQGSRLLSESLQAMASDMPEKQLEKPLDSVQPKPMVSEPYRPDWLKDYKKPEPVPEAPSRKASSTGSSGGSSPDSQQASVAPAEPEEKGMTSCSGGSKLEQDICADPELVALDRRIASALSGPSDPRYQEYLEQRQHWCAPQPSRSNRQECLVDLGNRLLRKL